MCAVLAILKTDVENCSHSGVQSQSGQKNKMAPWNKAAADTTHIATFMSCLIPVRDVWRTTFPLSRGPKEVSVGAEEMLS